MPFFEPPTVAHMEVAVTDGEHSKRFQIETADIVAIGILFLALAASLAAVIVAIGLVLGKVGQDAGVKIILGCVSGAVITGAISRVMVRSSRKTSRSA